MKKIIAAVMLFTVLGFSATAQNDKNNDRRMENGERGGNRFNSRFMEQLNLTATQTEQIKSINEDYRSKMQDMIKSELSVDERKTKRNEYDLARKNKIMAILTPEQVAKLQALQAEQKAKNDSDGDYKIKTKEDGEKTKIKVKQD